MIRRLFHHRIPWLSAVLVLLAAGLGSAAAVNGLSLQPITPMRTLPTIDWEEAHADSLAGRAVIIDLRRPSRRQRSPVPGGAIELPADPGRPAWHQKRELLATLEGTPVYLLASPGDWQGRVNAARVRLAVGHDKLFRIKGQP
ncbi:MAG: hypothetical protein R3336_06145 [Phycisphaeraceae bacterium]|nr:hypothetical protein [Phycisphaeraceae bacterium]